MLALRYGAAASLFILLFILTPLIAIMPLLGELCAYVNIDAICGPNSIPNDLLINGLFLIFTIFVASFLTFGGILVYMALRVDSDKVELEITKDKRWVKKYPQSHVFSTTIVISILTVMLAGIYFFVPDWKTYLEYPLSFSTGVFISILFMLISMWLLREESKMATRLDDIEDALKDIGETLKRIEKKLP